MYIYCIVYIDGFHLSIALEKRFQERRNWSVSVGGSGSVEAAWGEADTDNENDEAMEMLKDVAVSYTWKGKEGPSGAIIQEVWLYGYNARDWTSGSGVRG